MKARFNFKVSGIALSRWLGQHRAERSIGPRLEQIRQARDQAMLIGKVVGTATDITEANIVLIAQAVFEELVKAPEERDEAKLAQYMALGIKVKDQSLKARAG